MTREAGQLTLSGLLFYFPAAILRQARAVAKK